MATTSAITGRFVLPDNAAATDAVARFVLSGFDTDQTDSNVIAPFERSVGLESDGDLPPGVVLWRNTEGLRGTFYRVFLSVSLPDAFGGFSVRSERYLGAVQVGDASSYTLRQLFDNPVPEDPGWNVNLDAAEYAEVLAEIAAAGTAAGSAAASASAAAGSALAAAGSATAAAGSVTSAAAQVAIAGQYADNAEDSAAQAALAASAAGAPIFATVAEGIAGVANNALFLSPGGSTGFVLYRRSGSTAIELGQLGVSQINSTLTITIGTTDFPTYEDAIDWLLKRNIGRNGLVTVRFPQGVMERTTPFVNPHPEALRILLKGWGEVTHNGATVVSVTPNGAGWDVVYQLPNVTNIFVGMGVRAVNVGDSGNCALFVPTQGLASTNGTSAAATGFANETRWQDARNTAFSDPLVPSLRPTHRVWLSRAVIAGQEFTVTAATNSSLTLSGVPPARSAARVLAASPGSRGPGTISVSGTSLSGIGTEFTKLHPGTLLAYDYSIGSGRSMPVIVKIASITNDTAATLVAAPPAITGGTAGGAYWVTDNWFGHFGAFEVTAVDTVNNRVTVFNSSKVKPSVSTTLDVDLRFMRTTVKFTTPVAGGLAIDGGGLLADEMAWIGNGGGDNQQIGGVVVGRDNGANWDVLAASCTVVLGTKMAFINFGGPAVNVRSGGMAIANTVCTGNCFCAGSVTEGGTLVMRDGFHNGHIAGGMRMALEGFLNAEEARCVGCGGPGFYLTGGTMHLSYGLSAFNVQDVVVAGPGVANQVNNVLMVGSMATGSSGQAVFCLLGKISGDDSPTYGASSIGREARKAGILDLNFSPVAGCIGVGLRATFGGRTFGNTSDCFLNTSHGLEAIGPHSGGEASSCRMDHNGGWGITLDRGTRLNFPGSTQTGNVSGARNTPAGTEIFL